MRPASDGPCGGFSSKPDTRSPESTSTMPNWFDFLHEHRESGHGHRRLALEMELDHLLHVHPVDMVGAEDRDQVRAVVVEQVEVLKDGVGGTLVPALAHPHLGRDGSDELVVQDPSELPSVLEMLDKRLRAPLNQHVNRVNSRVYEIGQDEIDNPVLAAKGHRRLGAVAGQRMQPARPALRPSPSQASSLPTHPAVNRLSHPRFILGRRSGPV